MSSAVGDLRLPQGQNKALKLLLAIPLSSQDTDRWFSVQFSSPLSEDQPVTDLLSQTEIQLFYGAQQLQLEKHNIKILSTADKVIIISTLLSITNKC